jgi:hypothetical protein
MPGHGRLRDKLAIRQREVADSQIVGGGADEARVGVLAQTGDPDPATTSCAMTRPPNCTLLHY